MEEYNFKEFVDISIIDWIGVYEGGVLILLGFKILDDVYEILYWIHPSGKFLLEIEEKFYEKFPIVNIEKYEHYWDLVNYIDFIVLPKRDEIWKEFNILVDNQ